MRSFSRSIAQTWSPETPRLSTNAAAAEFPGLCLGFGGRAATQFHEDLPSMARLDLNKLGLRERINGMAAVFGAAGILAKNGAEIGRYCRFAGEILG